MRRERTILCSGVRESCERQKCCRRHGVETFNGRKTEMGRQGDGEIGKEKTGAYLHVTFCDVQRRKTSVGEAARKVVDDIYAIPPDIVEAAKMVLRE